MNSSSSIGRDHRGRGRGRADRGGNRDRAHQKRAEGGDELAVDIRTAHCLSPFFRSTGQWLATDARIYSSVVPIADFRQILMEKVRIDGRLVDFPAIDWRISPRNRRGGSSA